MAIPSTLMNFYGDHTRWFIGDVKSISDPMQLGRVQVRIHGIHVGSQNDIPDADLPWAQPLMPITEGGTSGLGNNLGIQVGARVFGIFLDGEHSQNPLIFGSLPKLEENSSGGRTTNQLARGTSGLGKVDHEDAPADPYAAVYPHNKVIQTTSGHAIEIDDTPNAERINIYHRSGAYIEFHPDGRLVIKAKETPQGFGGDVFLETDGDMRINCGGNFKVTAKRIELN